MDDAPKSDRLSKSPLIRVAMWRQSVAASGEDDGLTSVHVAILLMIAQYQGANDSSRVSQPKLAAAAGCGRSTAQGALADLVASGWVVTQSTDGGVVHYSIAIDMGRPLVARKASADRAKRAPAPAPSDIASMPGSRATCQVAGQGVPGSLAGGSPVAGQGVAREPGTKRPSEKTTEKTIEKTTCLDAPRPGVAGTQTNLFGEVKSDREKATKKPAGDSARRYGDAFVAGMADAGRTVSPPPASECRVLGSVLATHGKGDGGAALTGEAAETWIRETTAAYARACPDPGKRAGGSRPWGLRAWLDDGRPSQATAARGSAYAAPVVRAQPGTWASSGPGESYEELLTA